MGLLDSLGGIVSDVLAGKSVDIMSIANQALADHGGIQGLIAQLQSGGLGQEVASWIGTGENLPVSAEQIQSALGNETLARFASSFGLDTDAVATFLADKLPQAVDAASPEGRLEV
nr:YidB family protein [Mongoliimonas terrestris]